MRYQINNGELNELSDIPINPLSEEINNFDNGVMWYEDRDKFLYNYLKINNINMLLNKIDKQFYLKFSSDSTFTLSVSNPGWDGTIEYSLGEGDTWNIWDGVTKLSGNENNPIYLRGIANDVITGGYPNKWYFTGKYITGNIEALLDYQKVTNGQHPIMGNYCYAYMFCDCTSLVTSPELPATTLAEGCYADMFDSCTSLTTASELPATILADSCYASMFNYCTSLVTPPKLPATTLASHCYSSMFKGCISLTTTPKLPATTLADFCYQYMFQSCTSLTTLPKLPATTLTNTCYNSMFMDCSSIKLSTTQDPNEYQYPYRIPTLGIGTTASIALSGMFNRTGGTFTGTPIINTTYYTDHQPV